MADMNPHGTERTRTLGVGLVLTAVAVIALFLLHPAEHATDFAGFVKEQAASRVMDTVVHGGFILILGIQLAGYAIFSARLGWEHPVVVAALACFALGAVLQMGAVFADGVLTPALAARYATDSADHLAAARGVFVLCGLVSTWLRLFGGLFEAAAITAWGIALLRVSRLGGLAAMAIGLAMIAALAASAVAPQLGLMAILGLVAWAVIAGAIVIRQII